MTTKTHYTIEAGYFNAYVKKEGRCWIGEYDDLHYEDRLLAEEALKEHREAEKKRGMTYTAGVLQSKLFRLKQIDTKTQILIL